MPVGEKLGAMTGQGLKVGSFPTDKVHHQQPIEDQLVAVVKAVPYYLQHCDTLRGRQLKNMVWAL